MGAEVEVFWDDYGLGNSHSGVHVHAYQLFERLRKRNIHPKILSFGGLSPLFSKLAVVENIVPSYFSFFGSKILRPYASGRWLRSHVRKKMIVHGLSNFNVPSVKRGSRSWTNILTVHDLIPLLAHSDEISQIHKMQMRYCLPKSFDFADYIVCVSHWTKQCIEEMFPQYRQKLLVIPNGYSQKTIVRKKTLQDRERLSLIVTVSRWEPYKRLQLILDILKCSPLLSAIIVTDLRGLSKLRRTSDDLIASGRLKILTNVSDVDLQHLYSISDVYVQPSLYEGYCLPAADALRAGLPVVFCRGSGIDEVCQDFGCGMEREDGAEAWSASINRLILSPPSCLSEVMQSLPTWENSAEQLVNLYNGV